MALSNEEQINKIVANMNSQELINAAYFNLEDLHAQLKNLQMHPDKCVKVQDEMLDIILEYAQCYLQIYSYISNLKNSNGTSTIDSGGSGLSGIQQLDKNAEQHNDV